MGQDLDDGCVIARDVEPRVPTRPLMQADSPRFAAMVHGFATRVRRAGEHLPVLRQAGLWLYGEVTRWFPGGDQVERFGELGAGIFRGAQPSRRAFVRLKELGVHTVINLRLESDHEREVLAELALNYVYLPLPPLAAPSHADTAQFLMNVTDPAHGTVFFHCYHGVDRTGTMAACLRIARDSWTVEQAISEMRQFGLNEHGQRVKLDYVPDFYAWWSELPLTEQCRLLNRPIPATIIPSRERGVWPRVYAWLVILWQRLAPRKIEDIRE